MGVRLYAFYSQQHIKMRLTGLIFVSLLVAVTVDAFPSKRQPWKPKALREKEAREARAKMEVQEEIEITTEVQEEIEITTEIHDMLEVIEIETVINPDVPTQAKGKPICDDGYIPEEAHQSKKSKIMTP